MAQLSFVAIVEMLIRTSSRVLIPQYGGATNPKGIESLSPGLRVRELPWVKRPKDLSTLKGLHPRRPGVRNTTPSGLWERVGA